MSETLASYLERVAVTTRELQSRPDRLSLRDDVLVAFGITPDVPASARPESEPSEHEISTVCALVSMSDAQRETLSTFHGYSVENGSTLEHEIYDGELWITETASRSWDYARSQWIVGADGVARLL